MRVPVAAEPRRTSRLLPACLLAAWLLVGCPGRDASPGLREPDSPEAIQQPAVPAPPTDAPPTTPSGDPQLAGGLPAGVTTQLVEDGNRVYHGQGVCHTCHGESGEGTALGPPLNDQEWLHITGAYEEIRATVVSGVPHPSRYPAPMPPMGGADLSDREVRAVAAYVFALSRGVSGVPE